ncbi:rhomboid family intramembrane serine protease [Companilactobacillus metriopterae]|uniref:rhomboid family intramembrane serine protease n=1 Tax=Companilactobacillus metriopterae TaxID=1909267 RepID=UPI00100B1560|nr:rhomboid family intramembrane serine protease [Companilactobacillus metriopterae]
MFSYRNQSLPATYGLIILLVAVFVIETLIGGSTNPQVLLTMGAKTNNLVTSGQWWRLITPMFLHIGFMHLFMNCFSLYIVGQYLEPILGKIRFIIVFLISGVVGNLASYAFGSSYALSAGASTSIFGLFASFIALGIMYSSNNYIREMGKSFLGLIILNLAFDLFAAGIDIWGHIGGAIGGFLITFVVGITGARKTNIYVRILAVIALVAVSYYMYSKGMGAYGNTGI